MQRFIATVVDWDALFAKTRYDTDKILHFPSIYNKVNKIFKIASLQQAFLLFIHVSSYNQKEHCQDSKSSKFCRTDRDWHKKV